jgi:hypothetical protein
MIMRKYHDLNRTLTPILNTWICISFLFQYDLGDQAFYKTLREDKANRNIFSNFFLKNLVVSKK